MISLTTFIAVYILLTSHTSGYYNVLPMNRNGNLEIYKRALKIDNAAQFYCNINKCQHQRHIATYY